MQEVTKGDRIGVVRDASLDMGWQDGQELCPLALKLCILGLNPDPAINCHPVVSQAGSFPLA